MKKLIFLLILILIPFTLAQNSTIKVLFQSIEKNATIDLNQYFNTKNIYVNYSENLDIKIKDGIATIKAKENWKGAELIIFSTNETAISQPTVLIISKPKRLDLSEVSTNFYINTSFISFKKIHENLTSINLTIFNKSSQILINDNTLIKIDHETSVPLYSIEILATEKEKKQSTQPSYNITPYLITILLFVISLFILTIFKDPIFKLFKPKKEYFSKAKAKENALKNLDNLSLKGNTSKKIIRIINTFFKETYNIKPSNSYLRTVSLLKKRKIPYSLKEDLINYYERSIDFHNKKLKLKGEDLERFIENLKELIKRT